MIQRIQTAFLGLAAAALTALMFTELVHASGNLTRWGTMLLGVPAVAGAVGAIFLYTDRHKQRRLIVATQLITVLVVAVLYGSLYLQGALYVRTVSGLEVMRLVALMFPLGAYLCLILARRGVTRDIKLVESMDRIR